MIQAAQPKPVETKAPQRADAPSKVMNTKGKAEAKATAKSEDSEFAKELETNLKEGEVNLKNLEAEPKAVKVAEEQALELPSQLVKPEGTVETTSPKVFDPSITKGVEELIQPKTTEVQTKAIPLTDAQVLELAQGGNVEAPVAVDATEIVKADFAESLQNAPKLAQVGGRSPAIDFAKSEIDPQLLNNEDFVAQKNLVNKKVVTNAYGMKQVPADQKIALENGLKQTQVVKEAAAEGGSVNSQQFILNLSTEQTNAKQGNETQSVAPKTFDMNNIKSSNPTEIMNKITDYVVQAKASKEPTVNMRMKHDDLGIIDITVSKMPQGQDAIAINIGTHSADGKAFFQQNSKDLFSHLTNAGLNVSDLKVETPTQTAKNDFDFGSQSGKNQQGSNEKNFGSEQNQRRHDSDKRQDLWKLLNKEAA